MDDKESVLKWPAERRAAKERARRERAIVDDIATAIKNIEAFGAELDHVVNAVVTGYREGAKPQAVVSVLETLTRSAALPTEQEGFETPGDLLLVLACVEALRRNPTASMWEYLWSLAHNSVLLENNISHGIIAAAGDAVFKEQFIRAASQVVRTAVNDPIRWIADHNKKIAQRLIDQWKKNPALLKLWFGYKSFDSVFLGHADDAALRIVADIDAATFVSLVATYGSPYPVVAALDASRARSSFDRWKLLLRMAPASFDQDGRWNGSSIVPLLFVIGRDQLRYSPGRNASEETFNGLAGEVQELATEIASIVRGRADAAQCSARWATWLVRELMAAISNESIPFPANGRSRGFAESELINALAKEIPFGDWPTENSADCEDWEHWCYRAVLATAANAQDKRMPKSESFIDEWALDLDGWDSEFGQRLRDRADLFVTSGNRPDAYGIRLLALPIAEDSRPDLIWKQLWDSTSAIREIVEFGYGDKTREEDRKHRSAASDLMRILFGLGLTTMDQLIAPDRALLCDRQQTLKAFLPMLTSAVREMAAIDRLDLGYWSQALLHLATRRAVWLVNPRESVTEKLVFNDQIAPTLADFIPEFNGDTESLLGLVEVLVRNGVALESVKHAIGQTNVDLVKEIRQAERLLQLSPKHFRITANQISVARTLVDGHKIKSQAKRKAPVSDLCPTARISAENANLVTKRKSDA